MATFLILRHPIIVNVNVNVNENVNVNVNVNVYFVKIRKHTCFYNENWIHAV